MTWDILFTGLRSEDDDNSHIGAVSIFGVAFGMFVSALFNMVWNYAGNPMDRDWETEYPRSHAHISP